GGPTSGETGKTVKTISDADPETLLFTEKATASVKVEGWNHGSARGTARHESTPSLADSGYWK
ncbi:MAG: hypothetical protein ACTHQM_13800, partial [Thermoanaerobaculia bacterium]